MINYKSEKEAILGIFKTGCAITIVILFALIIIWARIELKESRELHDYTYEFIDSEIANAKYQPIYSLKGNQLNFILSIDYFQGVDTIDAERILYKIVNELKKQNPDKEVLGYVYLGDKQVLSNVSEDTYRAKYNP